MKKTGIVTVSFLNNDDATFNIKFGSFNKIGIDMCRKSIGSKYSPETREWSINNNYKSQFVDYFGTSELFKLLD